MSPLQYSSVRAGSARHACLSSRFAFVLLGVVLSLPAFGGGADVSPDEVYSDDVTVTMVDGAPLDINGDGNVDLAVATNDASSSRYYLGNGDGTFQGTPVLLDNRPASEIVAADLNGDTFIDLVQGVRDLRSRMFLGNGVGSLGKAIDILDADRVLAVAVGDLDNDGDPDLVTGTGQHGGEPGIEPLQENRFYLNSSIPAGGTPTFTGADIAADMDDTRSIALADLDGDGDLDVIAGNDETTPGSNRIYLNQLELGAGVSFAAGIDFGPPDDQTSKILVGDLDNDTDLDIVVLNFVRVVEGVAVSPGIDRFFLNELANTGTFGMTAGTDVSADATHSSGGALADFDGDGDLDIAVTNLTSAGDTARNRLYLNQLIESGSISFNGSDLSTDEHHSRELAAGNIDGDTHIDVVVGNQPITDVPGRDRIYLNNGTPDPFADADNAAPSFTSTPITQATEGASYTYEVTATDPDTGAALTITAPVRPAWLTLSDNGDGTATLTGTPGAADVGDHAVSLRVSDGTDTDAQDFTISVSGAPAGNNPPSFTSTPVTQATEGASYTYEVVATDPDAGAALTLTAPTLPAWLTLTDNGDGTATLDGTPGAADVGDHAVSLQVSDGTATALQDFTISVSGAPVGNNPPSFTSTPVTEATEDAAYTYEIAASDPDSGASLAITAPTLPAWLTLTDNGDGTATLAGTPAAADAGDHAVSLQVSDGTDTATQDFTITVEAASDPEPSPPPGGGDGDGGDSGGGSTGLGALLVLAACAAARRRRRG